MLIKKMHKSIKVLKPIFMAILLLIFPCFASSCIISTPPMYVTTDTFVFGNIDFRLRIAKGYEHVLNLMLSELNVLNNQINVNDHTLPNTDILRLNNAQAEEKIEIGYHAYTLLKSAKELYEQTDRLFNIAAYPLSYLWGMDSSSLSGIAALSFLDSDIITSEHPTQAEIDRVKEMCNLDNLTVTEEEGVYYAQKSQATLKVDLGGIAKGYAADLCGRIFKENNVTAGYVSISGNIYVHGENFNNNGRWEFGIRKPEISFGLGNEILCGISVEGNKTVLTSGDYERFRILEQEVNSEAVYTNINHIINPITGYPYGLIMGEVGFDGKRQILNDDTRVVSCTIVMDSSMLADVYATTACIKGLDNGKEFLLQNSAKALMFTADKKMANIDGVVLVDDKEAEEYKKEYIIVFPQ